MEIRKIHCRLYNIPHWLLSQFYPVHVHMIYIIYCCNHKHHSLIIKRRRPLQKISPNSGPFVTFRKVPFVFYTVILGKVYPWPLYNLFITVLFIWRRPFPAASFRAMMTRDPLNTMLVKPFYRAAVKLHDLYWTDRIVGSRRSDRNHA